MLAKRPLPFRLVAIDAISFGLPVRLLNSGCGSRRRFGRLFALRLQNGRIRFVENVNGALDDHVDHFRLGWEWLLGEFIGKHIGTSAGTAFAWAVAAAGA